MDFAVLAASETRDGCEMRLDSDVGSEGTAQNRATRKPPYRVFDALKSTAYDENTPKTIHPWCKVQVQEQQIYGPTTEI